MKQPKTIADVQVLVVEDDENNRLVLTKLLELAGVPAEHILALEGDPAQFLRPQPFRLGTQPERLDILSNQVDLILLDMQLPGKDGYEILRELRANGDLADVMVVVVTANVMRDDVERAQRAGFDGFIGKPINGPRFKEWLERLLRGEAVWSAVS